MKILVTEAKSFIGKNLCAMLESIRDGKEKTRSNLNVEEIFECDVISSCNLLSEYCSKADFIVNLAGINTDKHVEDGLGLLFDAVKLCDNTCTIINVLNKNTSEELLGEKSKATVIVYRVPTVFGKWCSPEDDNTVATLCNSVANDLPVTLDNREKELELVYIDDLVNAILDDLEECGKHKAPLEYKTTLGEIVDLLETFKAQPKTRVMPQIPEGSFVKKLYSTYLSYLPKEKILVPLKMNCDERGSFTELMRTVNSGQFSVNVSKPGIVKGLHWHNTKWEFFIVVSGRALIQQRRHGSDEIIEFEVSGEKFEAVHILPGYTHNIINLSKTDNLVTLMWCNEQYDANRPDTIVESV